MNRKSLLTMYGLKWNPFTPDVPTEALFTSPRIDSFLTRVENLAQGGGFALITGEPGQGKSVILRLLAARLGILPELTLGILARPQSGLADFYRELGDLFGVNLKPHNRWGGFKGLRERWRTYAETSLLKPVLLIDEAQEMLPEVLSELRLLVAGQFDTEIYLTVVLAGDSRLLTLFLKPELIPLASRIRTRLALDYANPDELRQVLSHALKMAGNPNLFTQGLQDNLVDHANGNYRVLMTTAGDLFLTAFERNVPQLDEKFYLELYQTRAPRPSGQKTSRSRAGV